MSEVKRKIVTIGGGTGTFVVLSGLKHLENVKLTAIVSVLDDGGSTGRLRDAYGFLPPGDARQALVALADDDALIRKLFNYRFTKGDVAGHNLGNLILTGLSDILGSGADAIEAASKTFRIKGRVLPVSTSPATLIATLEDGSTLSGEHVIDERQPGRSHIVSVSSVVSSGAVITEVAPMPVDANPKALKAIREADVVVLGPGDLYASTLADFTVLGMSEAVKTSKAKLIYIVNLFTKAGQTDGLSASQHVQAIEKHVGRKPDLILVHSGDFAANVLERYAKEHEYPVEDDLPQDASIVRGQFADVVVAEKIEGDIVPRSLIRHSSEKIALAIGKIL